MKPSQHHEDLNTPKKLAIFWPGYRKYNANFFQRLASDPRLTLKVIWIREHPEDDPPNEDFRTTIVSTTIGAKSIRISGYRLKTFFKLLLVSVKHVFWSDCVLTSTQAPLHSKVAFLFSKLLRKKVFIIIEQWQKLSDKSQLYRIYERIGYTMMRKCDTLFVHGENQKLFAIENGVPASRIRTLPFLSEDLRNIKASNPDLAQQLKIKDKIVIVYFGRITPRKGLKELLKAYKAVESEIPESVLLICGGADAYFDGYNQDADYENECITIAQALGNRVIMTGMVQPQEKHNYLAISDIFIHPHTSFGNLYEGWGLVINEATSMSLPVITTDRVGSSKNLVVDGVNGYIIPADDEKQLAEKITQLVKDKSLRDQFSVKSRELFERYHKPGNITKEILRAMRNDI